MQLDPAIITNTDFITLYDKRPVGLEVFYAESYIIPAGGIVRLREVPNQTSPSTVSVSGYNEVPYPPSVGQFSVNYDVGLVYFNSADIGNTVSITYNGKGSRVFAADINKITYPLTPFYTKLNGIVPDLPVTQVFTFPNDVIVGRLLKLANFTDATEATMVAGLTSADKGSIWFNTDSDQYKGFNGSSVILLG